MSEWIKDIGDFIGLAVVIAICIYAPSIILRAL
jgi:hypothetical protein